MSELTVSIQKVTPAQVKKWRESGVMESEYQRPLKPFWVRFLASQMRGDKFEPTNMIAFAHFDGVTKMVNGQHTSYAIEASGISQDLPVVHHKLSDANDVAHLYTKYDIGKSRNFYDALRAHGILEKTKLKKSELSWLGSAIKFEAAGFTHRDGSRYLGVIDHEEWIAPVMHYAPIMHKFLALSQRIDSDLYTRLRGRPVLSIVLATLAEAPNQAEQFWKRVAQDDGLVKGDPARAMVRFLYRFGQMGGGAQRETLSAEHYAKVVAHVWNKAYANVEFHSLYYNLVGESPITIHGTRYANGVKRWPVNNAGELSLPF